MEPEPRQPRRSLFAVWRWPWWVRSIVGVLVPATYVLSAAPIAYLLNATGTRNDRTIACFNAVYMPLVLVAQNSDGFRNFYTWEFELFVSAFGDPR